MITLFCYIRKYSEFTDIASNYHANLQLLSNIQIQREVDGLFHAESPICIILCTTSDLLKQFLISNGAGQSKNTADAHAQTRHEEHRDPHGVYNTVEASA